RMHSVDLESIHQATIKLIREIGAGPVPRAGQEHIPRSAETHIDARADPLRLIATGRQARILRRRDARSELLRAETTIQLEAELVAERCRRGAERMQPAGESVRRVARAAKARVDV